MGATLVFIHNDRWDDQGNQEWSHHGWENSERATSDRGDADAREKVTGRARENQPPEHLQNNEDAQRPQPVVIEERH